MMDEGLLIQDADPRKDLTVKVLNAAKMYEAKHGQKPNRCYVHPSALGGKTRMAVDGIKVYPRQNILKRHFWIGYVEPKKEDADERVV